jgi:hypothetical protein
MPRRKTMTFLSTRTVAFLVIPVVIIFGTVLLTSPTQGEANCPKDSDIVTLRYADKKLTPNTLRAARCSTLRIVNADTVSHQTAMGAHDHHTHYPGLDDERSLAPGESLDITLVRSGTFRIHDHLDDAISASITIETSSK